MQQNLRSSTSYAKQRQWRHASTQNKTRNGLVFRLMSYNILADSLAHENRSHLYRYHPNAVLEWNERWKRILLEIQTLKPDILCLQEVDHYEEIRTDLVRFGYSGVYAKRTGGCKDGCATFWKSRFLLSEVSRIYFSESQVLRNNVALICVLKHPAKHRRPKQSLVAKDINLTIANTHILYNPKRGDIKLGQVRILCDEVSRLSQKFGKKGFPTPCIIAGDFNASPESGIYKFMSHGSIYLKDYSSKTLSGSVSGPNQATLMQQRESSMPSVIFLPPWHPFPFDQPTSDPLPQDAMMIDGSRWWPDNKSFLSSNDNNTGTKSIPFRNRHSIVYDFKWACREIQQQIRYAADGQLRQLFPDILQRWSSDHIENAMGRSLPDILEWAQGQRHYDPFVLDHDLHLKSVYREVLGDEPKATSLHDRCQNTMDYVFFSPFVHRHFKGRHTYLMLQPFRILDFPSWSQGKTLMSLPNETFGSDHFCLCVDFCCKWTDNHAEAGLSLPPPSQGLESLTGHRPKRTRARRLRSKRKKSAEKNDPAQNRKQRKKQPNEGDLNETTIIKQ